MESWHLLTVFVQQIFEMSQTFELWLLRNLFCFREEKRTANIVADDPEGVSCLVIDRESFHQVRNRILLFNNPDTLQSQKLESQIEFVLLILYVLMKP